jgi:hypothetical protein
MATPKVGDKAPDLGRHSARADFQRFLSDAKERRFRYVLIF